MPSAASIERPSTDALAMRFVVAGAIVLVLACPLAYADWYAGDAVMHLVYAENAARGHFFEFNRGEPSSGETSIGYMLIVATIFRAARPDHVPIIVKIIDTLGWYGVIVVSYLTARKVLPAPWPLIVAVVVGTSPGSVSNATIGMENGLFALVATTVLFLIARWHWLSPETLSRPARDAVVGVLFAIGVALRPEGVPLTGIVLAYRMWRARADRAAAPRIFRQTLLTAIPAAVIFIGLTIFLHARTGDWLPQSALSRAALSAADAIWVGPVWFNLRFAERLVLYAPLTVFFAIGTWLVLSRRRCLDGAVDGLLLLEFWTFFALYSTVFGAVHLARYITFLMPPMVLIAAGGARWLWVNWTVIAGCLPFSKAAAYGGVVLLLAAVFSAETYVRLGQPGGVGLADVMTAPGRRAQVSDELLVALRDPSTRPVSIALQEAQIRYWLDDRFVVRSLDGRVDRALRSYGHRGNYDHLGYLRASDVRYLAGTVNYNRDRTRWALTDLETLREGETLRKDGLVFTKLPDDVYEVGR